ncbi:nuclear transport factor 2 family protein [Nocardioides campestrisoli]|uniref:nuclear transport factor 2 family protein n=1 Tax=Nocardioides campestrisoli TaxID=2736757 RepID=UPI0015E7C330|nr:nuclear transport factor 2 family protein [Nocardioides campestrisoli]
MADAQTQTPPAPDTAPGTARAFRAAVEARDADAMIALLADDVVFRSPVAHSPYPGKAITASILTEVIDVFADFRYVTEIGGADASDHALVFEARVGDKQLTGCDFLHLDSDGLIDDFMVMVRPLSAAKALADEMAARYDRIVARASRS